MILTEFNQKRHDRTMREEGRIEGQTEEREIAIKNIVEMCSKYQVPKESVVLDIVEKYEMAVDDAHEYVERFWK